MILTPGRKEYPTMSELYDRFQKELSQTTYDSEIQGNIQSVLKCVLAVSYVGNEGHF